MNQSGDNQNHESPLDQGQHHKVTVPDHEVVHSPLRFVSWLVNQGDTVIEGERIAEILVEGVLIEIRSPATGVCQQEWLTPDAVVQPRQVLGEIIKS